MLKHWPSNNPGSPVQKKTEVQNKKPRGHAWITTKPDSSFGALCAADVCSPARVGYSSITSWCCFTARSWNPDAIYSSGTPIVLVQPCHFALFSDTHLHVNLDRSCCCGFSFLFFLVENPEHAFEQVVVDFKIIYTQFCWIFLYNKSFFLLM